MWTLVIFLLIESRLQIPVMDHIDGFKSHHDCSTAADDILKSFRPVMGKEDRLAFSCVKK